MTFNERRCEMSKEERLLLQCALADLQGSLEAHEAVDRMQHDWKAHAQTIADIQEALDRQVMRDYASRVEKALRDVVDSHEQGDTPLAIDAAINRAADVLERGV